MIKTLRNKIYELSEKLTPLEEEYNELENCKIEMIEYLEDADPQLIPNAEKEIEKIYKELDREYNLKVRPVREELTKAENELLAYAEANFKDEELTPDFWKAVNFNVTKRNEVLSLFL